MIIEIGDNISIESPEFRDIGHRSLDRSKRLRFVFRVINEQTRNMSVTATRVVLCISSKSKRPIRRQSHGWLFLLSDWDFKAHLKRRHRGV
jgi:hypothetical protein